MSTEPVRHVLNGPTMGSRWSALCFADAGLQMRPVQRALQAAVDDVDASMSTWNPDSALMRLNRAPLSQWIEVPAELAQVLALGLAIGRESGGAFDIGLGDAVRAWGFGTEPACPQEIAKAMNALRTPAHQALEIEGRCVRKRAAVTLDLNGIAKGHGVDRLAQTLLSFGIESALVGIDGEMRALSPRPDGDAWTIAVEAPDAQRRAPHSILELEHAAVATSGDYRHWVEVRGRRLSHTIDPKRGAPSTATPASVTVIARSCAEADAWATALMVAGVDAGGRMAMQRGLDALFLVRDGTGGIQRKSVGAVFGMKDPGVA